MGSKTMPPARSRPWPLDPTDASHVRAWMADACAILDTIESHAQEATTPAAERRHTRAYLRRRMAKATRRLRAMIFELGQEESGARARMRPPSEPPRSR